MKCFIVLWKVYYNMKLVWQIYDLETGIPGNLITINQTKTKKKKNFGMSQ